MRNNFKGFKSLIILLLIVSMLGTQSISLAQQIENTEPEDNNVATQNDPKETVVSSKVFQGEVEINANLDTNFTGESKVVEKGTKLELTVSTVLSSDTSMEGDEFFAEIMNDLRVEGGVVVPIGSVVHGRVTETKNERRLGRDGYVSMEFDYIVTPDGREIPIEAKVSTKSSPLKSFAKVALTDAGYTLVGGALGGLLALKLGGLGLAVATHGYSIAGGAALGATVGATSSLVRKGKPIAISPGDQIKMKITSDLNLPVIKENSLADEEKYLEGLDVGINECKIVKDPFGSLNTITLNLDIKNKTDNAFSFFDVAIVNEQGNAYYPSPFNETDMWFQKISPGSKLMGNLSFSVDNPRQKHWLIFYDSYTRKPLAKFSIRNALRKLEASNKKAKKNKS